MKVVLETERLRLREFVAGDAEALVALDSDPEVQRLAAPGQPLKDVHAQRDKIETWHLRYYRKHPGCGFWAADEKPAGAFVGWFHLKRDADDPLELELGYRLLPSARRRGLATEGSIALIRKGFESLGAARISANALAINEASIRVMEKAGLRFEKKFTYPRIDLEGVRYVLTRSDWRAR